MPEITDRLVPAYEPGDVVFVAVAGIPRGLAMVCGVKPFDGYGDLLKLHDCSHTAHYYWVCSGWCKKVGRVDAAVLEAAAAMVDAEREGRGVNTGTA